jgi:3-carboxy-cis,cis-muconate cycloisomerase
MAHETGLLTWPGDDRAGESFSDAALLAAMVEVEAAWLDALLTTRVAPAEARAGVAALVGAVQPGDVDDVARASEAGGNPVIPLVALLRDRLGDTHFVAAQWIHRGLTSQDVLDCALVLCSRAALAQVRGELVAQLRALARLADAHRGTLMVARTLTQHAVPTTFGAKAATWARGLLDAVADIDALTYRAQFGGAAGTLAGTVELARHAPAGNGNDDAVTVAQDVAARTSRTLGLAACPPWHTDRAPLTRIGDTLVRCTDAWGRIANDVLTLSRPEIGELGEAADAGRGGSSTMPHKANPVLSVLLRRAALAAPSLAATLHVASAEAVDERPDGAWHVEWATLQTLARRTVVAASQAGELLAGLRVDGERMRATLAWALPDVLAEQQSLAALTGATTGDDPAGYLGANDALIDDVIAQIAAVTGGGGVNTGADR